MHENEVRLALLFSSMVQIGHGDLSLWWEAGNEAAVLDPPLFSHFINYNFVHNEVRDSHVALPPIGLRGIPLGKEYDFLRQNDVAMMMALAPRELYRSVLWSRSLTANGFPLSGGSGNLLEAAGKRYLRVREENEAFWDGAAKTSRNALIGLYSLFHLKPSQRAEDILFGRQTERPRYVEDKHGNMLERGFYSGKRVYPAGSVFEAIANLSKMSPMEAAGAILTHNISMPLAVSALGHEPDDVLLNALMTKMTGPQFFKSINMLKRYNVLTNPKLKSVFDETMERAKRDKHVTTLMAAHTAEVLEDNESELMAAVRAQLSQVQEAVMERKDKIDGDVIIAVDKSTSQKVSIELGKRLGALIAHQTTGKVTMLFFDTTVTQVDVTGKTLEQITEATREIMPVGNTSCGVAVHYAAQNSIPAQTIVEITDGGHNRSPNLGDSLKEFKLMTGVTPSFYFVRVPGDRDKLVEEFPYDLKSSGFSYQLIDFLGGREDWNSLAGIVNQIRPGEFELLRDIRATPLITLDQVFGREKATA